MKKKIIPLVLVFCLCFTYFMSNIMFCHKAYSSAYAVENTDNYTARALCLMDYNTGEILFEKNSQDKMPVASIVKLMTIELVCEDIEKGNLSLDDKIVVSDNASGMGGSQVFIESGGEYSVGDLLKSTIISSANDASVALAEKIAGSENNFVTLMNKKAKELGLKNTTYNNSTGLPTVNQFSCAEDTAKILKQVISHDIYHKYSTVWMDTLSHPKGRESELTNTNKLIRYYEGCDGGKTGSTSEAGYCLSATAKRGNMRLIAVVLGAENGKTRFAETSSLFNYGFANYENQKIVNSSNVLSEKLCVSLGKEEYIPVKPQNDIFVLTKIRDDNTEISTEIRLKENVKAPVRNNDIVGELFVIKNGIVINKTNIIATRDVDKATLYDNIVNIVKNWQVKN